MYVHCFVAKSTITLYVFTLSQISCRRYSTIPLYCTRSQISMPSILYNPYRYALRSMCLVVDLHAIDTLQFLCMYVHCRRSPCRRYPSHRYSTSLCNVSCRRSPCHRYSTIPMYVPCRRSPCRRYSAIPYVSTLSQIFMSQISMSSIPYNPYVRILQQVSMSQILYNPFVNVPCRRSPCHRGRWRGPSPSRSRRPPPRGSRTLTGWSLRPGW